MNKIAQYLNEHILGEVNNSESVRTKFSHDNSIFFIKPELVIHPRITNDIRKAARFTWQLAEKGHILPITMRGGGSDKTGAAIGKGIVINTIAHLNNIIFVSLKNKDQFVHVQPGLNFYALNEALKSNGMIVPTFPESSTYCTVGGAVANNLGGIQSGRYGQTGDWVTRLEVVLANGDLIETSRINKHELSKKKGLQTFEGEIYRKIAGVIEDNQQTISNKIANNIPDNTGYNGIAKVKGKDGSFDLTPLIIGSQGTLGLISEIVLKTTLYNKEESIIVATFDKSELARDVADSLVALQPTTIDILDGELFDIADTYGKKYIFSDLYSDNKLGSVLFVSFSDYSEHLRQRKVKQAMKRLSKLDTTIFTNKDYSNDELYAIREVESLILQPDEKSKSRPSIIDGASIPAERREEFIVAMGELANKNHIILPLHIDWLTGIVHTRPTLQLHAVSDKQKTFKLISEYMELVTKYGGSMSAESGEGRLRASAAYAQLDKDELDLYSQIREAFDPYGTLNPGVKQKSELKTLVANLDPDYNSSEFAQYSPIN
jgi:FAD/FMN-containing dehydrogenase